jgi:hypothetical protein
VGGGRGGAGRGEGGGVEGGGVGGRGGGGGGEWTSSSVKVVIIIGYIILLFQGRWMNLICKSKYRFPNESVC